jgi:integrase
MEAKKPLSLYLVIPPADLSRTKPLVRLILNQIGRRLTETLEGEKGIKRRKLLLMLDEFQHSPAYVSRVLSVIAAACRFAAKTKLVKSNTGELKEAKLLKFVPEVNYDTKWVAEVMHVAEPKPRDYVPTYEELASLLDTESGELLRRYDMIALNTWARPAAIVDLSVGKQVDFENDLIDLNPPNRRQNKKQRPVIRLTTNLRSWLEHWAEDRPLSYDSILPDGLIERTPANHLKAQFNRRSTRWMLIRSGLSLDEIAELFSGARKGDSVSLRQTVKAAEARGIQRITRYTLRHFMATRVRGMTGSNVGREQRSLWLGHGKRDATSWYETHDPEFLRECAMATDLVIDKLDSMMKRKLLPSGAKSVQRVTAQGRAA